MSLPSLTKIQSSCRMSLPLLEALCGNNRTIPYHYYQVLYLCIFVVLNFCILWQEPHSPLPPLSGLYVRICVFLFFCILQTVPCHYHQVCICVFLYFGLLWQEPCISGLNFECMFCFALCGKNLATPNYLYHQACLFFVYMYLSTL